MSILFRLLWEINPTIEQVSPEKQRTYLHEPIAGKLDKGCLEESLKKDVKDMQTVKKIIRF